MTGPIFLAHTPHMRTHYYGAEALAALHQVAPVTMHEGAEPLDAAGLVRAAAGARVIVADRMTEGRDAVFAGLPELSAFVRVAVDIRNVDVAAASAAGVLVTRAGPGFIPSVAELILGLMIDLSRGISRSVLSYRAGQAPVVATGRQLAGATLGIVGYGGIGRYLVPLGAALGMRVLVADPHVAAVQPPAVQLGLDELLDQSDYLVCLAAATEATEKLMDASAFARMRRGAFFINASRGNLVDEAALEAALSSGQLGGAALDVGRAPDQMPSPGLARRHDVIATPHIGGLTPQAIRAQAMETVDQVRAILAGTAPPGAVNAEAWLRRP